MEKITYDVSNCVSTVFLRVRSVVGETYEDSYTDGLRDQVEIAIWKPLNIIADIRAEVRNRVRRQHCDTQ